MNRTPRVAAISMIGGALLALPATAHAAAAPSPTPHAQATTSAQAQKVLRYWTPERMRHAIPMEKLLNLQSKKLRSKVRRGLASQTPATLPNPGGAWSGGGKVTHTVGRVFFTFQGSTASCSGDAVTSGNKSTVITAGHCVKYEGAWHTNWVFVPGYNNGNAPYGKWTAKKTLSTPQWVASEDLNYDVGAAVVNQLDGKSLTDVVGGQGIAFNQDRGQEVYDFGYPAEAPYDGTTLDYCSGTTIDDPLGSNDEGLLCDMTGGSSGGPWFLKFDESTGAGVQNSVNSFKYTFLPTHMFGPYFGDEAQNLYNTAQSG